MLKRLAEFNEEKPKILGALFTLLSRAMAEYPRVELLAKPRMADFAKWECAVARALGKSEQDFIKAYQANIGIQNEEVLEASPIAQILIQVMKDKSEWVRTPTQLLSDLKTYASANDIDIDEEKFPSSASWVWRRLSEVIPNLKESGIQCKRDKSKGRKITIINNRVKEAGDKQGAGAGTGIQEGGKRYPDFEELDREYKLSDST